MPDTDFTGFPPETFAFLTGLAAHNEKDWFEDHRADYQAHVLDPSLAFIAAMGAPLARIDPAYQAVPKLNGSFRRLNRDVRFSKDKTPYDPRIHLVFWLGDHPNRSPGIHLVLHADGLGFGAGAWAWPPEVLQTFRAAMDETDARETLIKAIGTAAEVGATLTEPALKKVPKGWAPDHPAADLLRRKGLVVRTRERLPYPPEVGGPEFVSSCESLCRGLHPINNWLIDKLN